MSIDAFRFEWPTLNSVFRPSVLGRAGVRKVRSDADDASDEAVPSLATKSQIHAYLDAWRNGDKVELERALNNVVDAWRADNGAGGVPVHAHLPLPDTFAKMMAQLARETVPAWRQALVDIVAKLDPGVRTVVSQQMSDLWNRDVPADDRHIDAGNSNGAARDERASDHDAQPCATNFRNSRSGLKLMIGIVSRMRMFIRPHARRSMTTT